MALPKLCQVGILINILYLIGWVVALIGLALSQDWCADNQALIDASEAQARAAGLGEGPGYTFLSHERGTKCRSLYRFPWFIWALSTLPVLLSMGHLLRPHLVRRGSAALAAVLAVLQMIATDTFHNLSHSRLADAISKVQHGNQVCVVGFAILAAMSLLMILLESLLGDRHLEQRNERKAEEARARGDATGGKVGTQEPAIKV